MNNPNLTACPDCSREVSRRAAACPHCGAPMAPVAIQHASQAVHRGIMLAVVHIIFWIVAGGVILALLAALVHVVNQA